MSGPGCNQDGPNVETTIMVEGAAEKMKAVVVHQPGGPEVLKLEERLRPRPSPGWVLVRIRAFGLNRAELFTRNGDSGDAVKFPRIIGIECVGEVVEDPDGEFSAGQTVAAMMGGMGRDFDGSYAEYSLLPHSCIIPINTTLPWENLGAIPEMFQTALGSLRIALNVQSGKTILIRGGTSSVGLTSITLARDMGLKVLATTRNPQRQSLLEENGAHEVWIDSDGELSDRIRQKHPGGLDYVLELLGTKTLNDSLSIIKNPGGICCMTGILGGSWELNGWNPMEHLWNGKYLTAYSGEGMDQKDLQYVIDGVQEGRIRLNTDRVFALDQIQEAHKYMEANQATGKCVVLI